ncbi:MAG: hypothetical protein ACLFPN_01835 [Methanomassiliicoccales archaeon]
MEDEERPEETEEEHAGTRRKLEDKAEEKIEKARGEAEELLRGVVSEEAREHLFKAGSEMLLAMDSVVPHSKVPVDVRRHYLRMKKEFLLMAKSLIDSNLDALEEKGERSERLKKIELD